MDPLDEPAFDVLDEPLDDMIKRGSDPAGFEGSLAVAHERATLAILDDRDQMTVSEALTMRKKRAFLISLSKVPIQGLACGAAGVTPSTIHTWRKSDKAFVAAEQEALAISADMVEGELMRRAVDGVEKDVWNRKTGKVIGKETVYSDNLLALFIKRLKPEQYRERQEVKHDVETGGVLLIPSTTSLADWEAASATQQQKHREKTDES